MAGGRPQPASQMRRPATPTQQQWPGEFAVAAAATATATPTPVAVTSPAAAAVVCDEVGGVSAGSAGGAAAAVGLVSVTPFVSLVPPPANATQGPAPRGALRASPVPLVGGLYGQTYLAGQGRTRFDPSSRMDNW